MNNIALIIVSTIGAFAVVITCVRVIGLRSFSKMSSFDFAMTIAAGTVFGSTAVRSVSFTAGTTTLITLFAVQYLIAQLRRKYGFGKVVDNQPVVLMKDGKILQNNLESTRVTENDLLAKLREANVLDMSNIQYVILETTGDISVLHGDNQVDSYLIRDAAAK